MATRACRAATAGYATGPATGLTVRGTAAAAGSRLRPGRLLGAAVAVETRRVQPGPASRIAARRSKGHPAESGDTGWDLLGPRSSYVTGQVITVDGGLSTLA